MTTPLTRRQLDLLNFIKGYAALHDGVIPTFEEMRIGIGMGSKSGIYALLRSIEERGFIVRLKHRNRAIAILATDAVGLSDYERGWRDAMNSIARAVA